MSDTTGEHEGGTEEPRGFFRFWRCFWLLFLVGSLGYAWHCFYVPSNSIAWAADYASARQQASASDKPMVLFFTGDWCVPCRIMKRTVWADDEVMTAVNGEFVPLLIDVDEPDAGEALSEYQVGATPVTIVTDSEGNTLERRVGGISKAEFLAMLEQVN